MKSIYLSLLILFFMSSCIGYRTTAFTTNSIHLGINKKDVLKKFGKPFKTSFNTDNKSLETVCYKEAVDVSEYTYIMTSILTFKNSTLINFEQKDELIQDGPDIKVQTTKTE